MYYEDMDSALGDHKENPHNLDLHSCREFPCILPASPNWYCTSVISYVNDLVAFGAKNSVYIGLIREGKVLLMRHVSGSAVVSKITAVQFLYVDDISSQYPMHCAFAQEDGLVRISDPNSGTYKEHHKHKGKVTVLSWTVQSPNVLFSGDDKGSIAIWKFRENQVVMWTPVPCALTCHVMSPHFADVGVFGYSNGNIVVANLAKPEILQHFKSHVEDITALSWCPVSKGGYRFASASKDQCIRIWDATKEKSVLCFKQPQDVKKAKSSAKTSEGKTKAWLAALWLDECTIISSHASGALIAWNIESEAHTVLESGHTRAVFAIVGSALSEHFVSVSMDRQIIVWHASTFSPATKLPSFGGFAYSLSCTPLFPLAIAVGVGDSTIRVWNIGKDDNPYSCVTLSHNIKSKVTVVAMHPNKEGILGFATDDGHVGCYNFLTMKSDISATYHKKTVYSLSWGPVCSFLHRDGIPVENGDFLLQQNVKVNCLYSVGGEGALLMHKLGAFNEEACAVNGVIKKNNDLKFLPNRSEVAWKADYRAVAVGNDDGSVHVFSAPYMIMLCQLEVHSKIVNCISWHHSICDTAQASDYSWWLASGSNESNVCVSDLTFLNQPDLEYPVKVKAPSCSLAGHGGRITRVQWNPHAVAILASASYDGSVQVWDVRSASCVANYQGHAGRVMSFAWSCCDPDVAYSGGEDFTVRRWRVSEQKNISPPTGKKGKFKAKSPKLTSFHSDERAASSSPAVEAPVLEEAREKEVASFSGADAQRPGDGPRPLPEHDSVKQPCEDETAAADDDIALTLLGPNQKIGSSKKKKNLRSLMPLSAVSDRPKKEEALKDVVKLARYLKEEETSKSLLTENSGISPGRGEYVHFGLYTDRPGAFRMIGTEVEHHSAAGNFDLLFQLEAWRGNIVGALDQAISKENLTEAMLALSPLGGDDVWRACLLAYAEQMEKRRNFQLAAMYFLAVGDVYRAIDVLRKNFLFKEALCLAKLRLASNEPLIRELYIAWAEKLLSEHNMEIAVKCYLAANMVDHAIDLLAKSTSSSSLYAALQIARIYGLEERRVSLQRHCVQSLQAEAKWSLLRDVLRNYDDVKEYHLLAVVGEFLVDRLLDCDLLRSSPLAAEHKRSRCHTIQGSVNDRAAEHLDFVNAVLRKWKELFGLDEESARNFAYLDFHIASVDRRQLSGNLDASQLVIEVTRRVSAGLLSLVRGESDVGYAQWLAAFAVCYASGHRLLLGSLYNILLPSGVSSLRTYTASRTDIESSGIQSFTHFQAYFVVCQMYSIWWNSSLWCGNDGVICEPTGKEEVTKNLQAVQSEKEQLTCVSNVLDVYAFICLCSTIVLSPLHADVARVSSLIRKVEDSLLELDLKTRLQLHMAGRSGSIRPDESRTPEGRLGEADVRGAVEDKDATLAWCKEVASSDYRTGLSLISSAAKHDTHASRLLAVQEFLRNELERFPEAVRNLPWIELQETALVLLCLCRMASKHLPEEIRSDLRRLVQDIRNWATDNCITQDGFDCVVRYADLICGDKSGNSDALHRL